MMEDHYDGIILDLRGNGGGYLEEASKFLGHFLPKGEVTVQSEYNAFTSIDLKSTGKGELENIPLVVLVDQLTASAGEIIALTLQERGVPIVGMPTFGKGTIQTFTALDDGSSLKYTVGKWFSPQHVNVNGTGILPDFEIQRDQQLHIDKQIDTQLEKAKEVLFTLIN
jgi:carboxyl-terminal processing protease